MRSIPILEGKHKPVTLSEPMSEESYGRCEGKLKKKRCYRRGYLADGLCEVCWDKSVTNKTLGPRKHVLSEDNLVQNSQTIN